MNRTVKFLLALFTLTSSFTTPCLACYDEAEDDYYDYYSLDTDGDGVDDLWVVTDEDGHGIGWGYVNEDGDFEYMVLGHSDNESDDGTDNEGLEDDSIDDEDYPEEENEVINEDDLYDYVDEEATTTVNSLEEVIRSLSNLTTLIDFLLHNLDRDARIVFTDQERNYYNSEDGKIYLNPNFNEDELLHEVIHVIQDYNNMLNGATHGADNEFQSYFTDNILRGAAGVGSQANPMHGFTQDQWKEFGEIINTNSGRNDDGTLWYNQDMLDYLNNLPYEEITKRFRDYWEEKKGPEMYYKNHDPEYDWNWEELLNSIGFRKKK